MKRTLQLCRDVTLATGLLGAPDRQFGSEVARPISAKRCFLSSCREFLRFHGWRGGVLFTLM
jgi:hypothetical protein